VIALSNANSVAAFAKDGGRMIVGFFSGREVVLKGGGVPSLIKCQGEASLRRFDRS
jgi:hypothetical protein